jgi:hypothetical protein
MSGSLDLHMDAAAIYVQTIMLHLMVHLSEFC